MFPFQCSMDPLEDRICIPESLPFPLVKIFDAPYQYQILTRHWEQRSDITRTLEALTACPKPTEKNQEVQALSEHHRPWGSRRVSWRK